MTPVGGTNSLGTIFGINPDGSGYSNLYSFAGGAGDGAAPEGDLLPVGSTFFGMTSIGGSANLGTIFSFTPIPEPGSLTLLCAAAAAGWLVRRR